MNNKFFKCPRLWSGATCFIIGGGPSLAELDLTPIHKRRVIGVNAAYTLGLWVDICFWLDERFARWNREGLTAFPNLKIAAYTGCERDLTRLPQVATLTEIGARITGRAPARELSHNPDRVGCTSNSGSAAINLAVHLGVKTIVLLGFDMKPSKGKHNWHDLHQHQQNDDVYQTKFLHWYDGLAIELEKVGVKCYNANPDSALDVFPKLSYEEAILL